MVNISMRCLFIGHSYPLESLPCHHGHIPVLNYVSTEDLQSGLAIPPPFGSDLKGVCCIEQCRLDSDTMAETGSAAKVHRVVRRHSSLCRRVRNLTRQAQCAVAACSRQQVHLDGFALLYSCARIGFRLGWRGWAAWSHDPPAYYLCPLRSRDFQSVGVLHLEWNTPAKTRSFGSKIYRISRRQL